MDKNVDNRVPSTTLDNPNDVRDSYDKEPVIETEEITYDKSTNSSFLSENIIVDEVSISDDASYEGFDADNYNPSTEIEDIIVEEDSIKVILRPKEQNDNTTEG